MATMYGLTINASSKTKVSLVRHLLPEPKRGEVRVKLKSASLNRRDFQAITSIETRSIKPCILGSDGAGVIDAFGPGVKENMFGKEVIINPNINWGTEYIPEDQHTILGIPTNGTIAEYITVKTDRVISKPKSLSWIEAAAIPLCGLTAYRSCFEVGQLGSDQTILITGIGGGVSSIILKFAKVVGCSVFVTSSDDGKIENAMNLGACGGMNYLSNRNLGKEITPDMFDSIYDGNGGSFFNLYLLLLKPGGKLIQYGALSGLPLNVNMYLIYQKQISVLGTSMGSDVEFHKMVNFFERNELRPIVDSVYPMYKYMDAIDRMNRKDRMGKVIIAIN